MKLFGAGVSQTGAALRGLGQELAHVTRALCKVWLPLLFLGPLIKRIVHHYSGLAGTNRSPGESSGEVR